MAKNIVFLLTEGEHDASFLYRILKANGFSSFTEVIKDFPKPLDKLLQIDIMNVSIEEITVQHAKSRFLPVEVLERDENLILIYAIGGESKSDLRVTLIKSVNALNVQDPDAVQALPDTDVSILFFFDADQIGTQGRMKQVEEELRAAFPKVTISEPLVEREIYEFEDIEIGAYIFKENSTDSGMLEDILIPLMNDGNGDIFDTANQYLSIHSKTNLFKSIIKYDSTGKVLLKVGKYKFSYKKSLIGTIGQLQKSGKSNSICIRETDYLNDTKIINNQTCDEIFKFIDLVIIQ